VNEISKGLDLPISGVPVLNISDQPKCTTVSLLGNDFVGMKPTMLVKVGDQVKAGRNFLKIRKI
jgi:Na+-transporting NADH:ubiquinone oxidoreductase subunit A